MIRLSAIGTGAILVTGMNIRKKFKALKFLLRGLGQVPRSHRFRLGKKIFLSALQGNLASGLGDVVSELARLRRSDNSLYKEWIDQFESVQGSTSDLSQTVVLVNVPADTPPTVVKNCWTSLLVAGFSSVVLINGGSLVRRKRCSLSFTDEPLCLDELFDQEMNKPSNSILWLMSPGLVNADVVGSKIVQDGFSRVTIFDHDHIVDGRRTKPFFKPKTFDPNLIRCSNYVSAVLSQNVSVARNGAEPSENLVHFLVRRLCEGDNSRIDMCSKVALHMLVDYPPVILENQARVYAKRVGDQQKQPGKGSSVNTQDFFSIIIPTKDRLDLLSACVDSIYRASLSVSFEIVIVDNRSTDQQTLEWLNHQSQVLPELKVIRDSGTFNWSRLCNVGASVAIGNNLIMLNNDTEVVTDNWLSIFSMALNDRSYGVVGPMLQYPNGKIQHAGTVIGFGGAADHVFAKSEVADQSIFVSPDLQRRVTACTGACMAFRRDLFDMIGGFNEDVSVVGDVLFCLDVFDAGYHNLYCPDIVVTHFESLSRRSGLPESDKKHLSERVRKLAVDPYFHPELSMSSRFPTFRFS